MRAGKHWVRNVFPDDATEKEGKLKLAAGGRRPTTTRRSKVPALGLPRLGSRSKTSLATSDRSVK